MRDYKPLPKRHTPLWLDILMAAIAVIGMALVGLDWSLR